MKVLIVDDEEDVRDSIRLLVDWDEFQITTILEASEGSSAMALILSEKPEIIFTDMKMPNVDGMELLQWIETEAPTTKTIVISGYDDYTYIRKTMKHGGLDYLLKPINRGELLESLRNAVKSWHHEEEERRLHIKKNVEINQTKNIYWDKVLSKVVSRPGYYRTVEGELGDDFGWSTIRGCQIAMLLTDPLPRIIMQKFGKNLDLLYFLMTNICNEIIGSRRTGYAFKHTDPNYGIILMMGDIDNSDFARKLNEMNDAFLRILGARFYFACSTNEAFPDNIHIGFEKALKTARSISFLQGNDWVYRFTDAGRPEEKRVVLADYSDRISVAVYSGDLHQIDASIAKWMQAISQLQVVTSDHLKYWRYEFELLRNHLLQYKDYPVHDRDGQMSHGLYPIDQNGKLSLEEWQKEWTEEFGRIADILKNMKHKEHNVIFQVKQFIDTHYKQNLSLQDISSRFFISREYVSRRFKQEFGMNISEYLEQVRIDHAKILLSNEKYLIATIAEMVGYQDGRYFSKIFGKLTGKTPREYRKKNGGIGDDT
ncbi:response regulator [Paenibacillus sp. N4]|uniref:response regulator transcription factor n=1 Tax=Paenibacillus vietnamensis TaxID=2590547 RepID=UPI001CD055F5|nr:response regulator [Paenibacillus vietnamensis]MCA0754970.1 response regulator [Paenibacillus vietnamensis]